MAFDGRDVISAIVAGSSFGVRSARTAHRNKESEPERSYVDPYWRIDPSLHVYTTKEYAFLKSAVDRHYSPIGRDLDASDAVAKEQEHQAGTSFRCGEHSWS